MIIQRKSTGSYIKCVEFINGIMTSCEWTPHRHLAGQVDDRILKNLESVDPGNYEMIHTHFSIYVLYNGGKYLTLYGHKCRWTSDPSRATTFTSYKDAESALGGYGVKAEIVRYYCASVSINAIGSQ